jgi:hypothetical protein
LSKGCAFASKIRPLARQNEALKASLDTPKKAQKTYELSFLKNSKKERAQRRQKADALFPIFIVSMTVDLKCIL